MTVNLTQLKALIESKPALLAEAEAGNNTGLLALLSAQHPTGTISAPLSKIEFLVAAGDGMRSLSTPQLHRLTLLMSDDIFDTSKVEVRDELREVFVANAGARNRIATATLRPATVAEEAVGEAVGLKDVRAAVKLISSSHYNKYLRGEV